MDSGVNKRIIQKIKRITRILLVAFMLGLSNVILQEIRMIEDSAIKIELECTVPDDEPFD